MAVSDGYKALVRDLLSDFGPITIKNMFGGAGVYAEGAMIAILDDDTLYFKTNEITVGAYQHEGQRPFRYKARGKTITLSYWQVPDRLLDDPEELAVWARAALEAATKTKSRRKPR